MMTMIADLRCYIHLPIIVPITIEDAPNRLTERFRLITEETVDIASSPSGILSIVSYFNTLFIEVIIFIIIKSLSIYLNISLYISFLTFYTCKNNSYL